MTAYFFSIDDTYKGSLISSLAGPRVEVGLESYTGTAQVSQTTHSFLHYQVNGGGFLNFSGRDSSVVDTGMCGSWLADTSWRAGEGASC